MSQKIVPAVLLLLSDSEIAIKINVYILKETLNKTTALTGQSATKVVLARFLGEVGTLCIVLLSFYSRTCLPICIKIGSYSTDTEQKQLAHF